MYVLGQPFAAHTCTSCLSVSSSLSLLFLSVFLPLSLSLLFLPLSLHFLPFILPPSLPLSFLPQVKDDSSVDYYPIQFKVYRHTTLPPPAKPSSLPWPIASVFGTLGIVSSSKPVPSAPLNSAGIGPGGTEGGPIQPPLPRRALYYYAAFTASTTLAQV